MGKIVALSPDKRRLYVLKEQQGDPKDVQVSFFYRILSARAYYKAQDKLIEFYGNVGRDEETRTGVLTGTQEKEVLVDGLIDVENLQDEDNRDFNWPQGDPGTSKKVREDRLEALSFINPRHRRELAAVILNETPLSEPAAKNSVSPPALL